MRVMVLVFAIVAWVGISEAGEVTAASCTPTAVQAAISTAATGDTVRVPPGTCTWSSAISLPVTKDLAVIGATVVSCSGTPITCTANDRTTLTCTSGVCFTINVGAAHRISGFTLLAANSGGIASTGNQNLSKAFRIDHNRIVSNTGWAPVRFSGGSNAVAPQGIVDSNILVDISFHSMGTRFMLDDGIQQHQLWAQNTQLGDSTAVLYIEGNHFQQTSSNSNNADGNYGGRYVYRFNNTTSGRQSAEMHSVQGENRSMQRWEVYGNHGSNPSGWAGVAFVRGGSGVIFNNTLQAAGSWGFGIIMDNVRSEGDPGGGVGACAGSSRWDLNSIGGQGYRCRDQVGSGHDITQWSHTALGPHNQTFKPAYYWGNRMTNGNLMSVEVQNEGRDRLHIQPNRDYYTEGTFFDGTSGVGVGPVANRPATCTTGVAYWATDEGEWNSLQPGPDGRLYKCVAPHTWALYYTPYPYPHPWRQGGGAPPAAPTGLQVR